MRKNLHVVFICGSRAVFRQREIPVISAPNAPGVVCPRASPPHDAESSGEGSSPGKPGLILRWGWRLLLCLVPITSPVVLGGEQGSIRPPASLLAVLLTPLAVLCGWRWLRADPAVRRLAIWALAVIGLGALLILIRPFPPFAGKPGPWPLFVKAVLSIVSGLGVYLVARVMLRDRDDLHRSLPWLGSALVVAVLLAGAQTATAGADGWARTLVEAVSSPFCSQYGEHSLPHSGRGHGFAYEPSYLASQILLLLLPLTVIGLTSLSRPGSRVWGMILAATAGFGLMVSGSRAGIALGGALLLGSIFLLLVLKLGRSVIPLAVCLGIGALPGYFLIKGNAYLVSGYSAAVAKPKSPWVQRLSNAGLVYRAASTVAAASIFAERPLLGTGLGQSPLLLPRHLPEWSREDLEISRALGDGTSSVLKPMAMLARLPAETGLVGSLLLLWFIWAHRPRRSSPAAWVVAGLGSGALLIDSILLASFALPSPWILLAIMRVGDDDDSSRLCDHH